MQVANLPVEKCQQSIEVLTQEKNYERISGTKGFIEKLTLTYVF